MNMQPDDPRLTAYALGELEGDEHARVAAAVKADPALQAVVAEIEDTATHLTAALAAEPLPEVEPIILPEPLPQRVRQLARRPARAHLFRFPYVAIGTLAAACFAVVFLLLNQQESARQLQAVTAQSEADPMRETPVDEAEADAAVPFTLEVATSPATVPPAAAEARDAAPLASAPAQAPAVAAAAENDAAPATGPATAPGAPMFALAPTTTTPAMPITATPNPTGVPVRQTPVTSAGVAAGLARDDGAVAANEDRPADPAATAAQLADNQRPMRSGFVGEAALPAAGGPDAPLVAGDANAGYYQHILRDDAQAADPLQLTFREFGDSRYGNRGATPAGPADGVTLAANPAERPAVAAPPAVADAATGTRERNIKTEVNLRPRVAYEQSPADLLRNRDGRQGTLDPGEPIADLETQLRELQRDGGEEPTVHDFVRDNEFVTVSTQPTSVFPVAGDAASHVSVRRALQAGAWPARDLVRIDELLNQHRFDYPAPPADGPETFAGALEVARAPWAPERRLVRVGLKARNVSSDTRPPANVVLLVESSAEPAQLPAIKQALRAFVDQLGSRDQVALALHDGAAASLVLPTTPAADRTTIFHAFDALESRGTATGTTGLQLAYDIARAHFVPGGINRVILAVDGDTRIGEARRDAAVALIDRQARDGIALSALGFGVDNIRDSMLEQISHRGSGDFAFIDTPADAQRMLGERLTDGFTTVARNVKVQVEFNPARVQSWRMIGYEDRVFLREDFDPESLAADVIGAGHTVTALFEVVPASDATTSGTTAAAASVDRDQEMLTVTLRYQEPENDEVRLQHFALADRAPDFAATSTDFQFAAAVAGFGMILRDSPYRGTTTLADVAAWAENGRGLDRGGLRSEFIDLVTRAQVIAR